jgi:hypothetical protein
MNLKNKSARVDNPRSGAIPFMGITREGTSLRGAMVS